MKTIDILYIRYFDLKGEVMTLGGIQTYISQLTKLALKIGFQVRIFNILTFLLKKLSLITLKLLVSLSLKIKEIQTLCTKKFFLYETRK